ncbi:hypothetical protein O6H91_19G082000 [Diphasiastrum complanatum]|uniref:Uncharacterized protein n=1 Tax=Diphasiastrum complanatum TaxID=34168 RepID=A0ACC2AYB9_DIPCM|nr:hypothetical protein O6H91_19G082000 [Diphasiastrum complanatum]
MAWELLLWLWSMSLVGALLAILVYQLICLSDLEFDYINPYDTSSRINNWIIPEYAIHGGLSVIYLFSGYWLMFLLNLPLLGYHTKLYMIKQHKLDVTEIFSVLNHEKKLRFIKLGFYLVLLLVVVFRVVVSAVELTVDSIGESVDSDGVKHLIM